MATIDNYNFAKVAEVSLLHRLKIAVAKNLLDKLTEDFRRDAEVLVKKEVEKLTIKSIEVMRDCMKMEDEVRVYCKWEGDEDGQ